MTPGVGTSLLADARRVAGDRIGPLLATMVAASALEGFGILLLVPLVAVIGDREGWLAQQGWAEGIIDLGEGTSLAIICALFVAVMAARAGLLLLRDRQQSRLLLSYERSLRVRTLQGLAGAGWARAAAIGQADFHRMILSDASRASAALYHALRAAALAAIIIIYVGLAAVLSPSLTLVVIAAMLGAGVLARPWIRASGRRGRAVIASIAASNQSGGKAYQGLKSALAEGRAHRFAARFSDSLAIVEERETALMKLQTKGRALASIASAIAAIAILLAGRLWLSLELALLLPLLVIYARTAGPVRALVEAFEGFAAESPAFEALGDLVERSAAPDAEERHDDWRRLELSALRISNGERFALGPIDYHIERGEWISVLGPSGSGKTTLVDTVVGLREAADGQMTLDGMPIDPATDPRWRAGLSYVGQREWLPAESIRDILSGYGEVTDEQIAVIAELCGLDEAAAQWPEGLDTLVGEQGHAISGGEAQRIAIARALLRRPSLLILDEATNALDEAGEAALLSRLREWGVAPCVLMIAHRAAAHRLTDRKLDLGRLS